MLHLSDLVRMAFMAATDNSTQLRLVGLDALQVSYNMRYFARKLLVVLKR